MAPEKAPGREYTSSRAEIDFANAEREREEWELSTHPEGERRPGLDQDSWKELLWEVHPPPTSIMAPSRPTHSGFPILGHMYGHLPFWCSSGPWSALFSKWWTVGGVRPMGKKRMQPLQCTFKRCCPLLAILPLLALPCTFLAAVEGGSTPPPDRPSRTALPAGDDRPLRPEGSGPGGRDGGHRHPDEGVWRGWGPPPWVRKCWPTAALYWVF